MQRAKLNYIVDAGMFVSFLITAFTGLLIFFFLPSGVSRGGYQEFWGITKNVWVLWHDYAGIVMIVLVVVHFVLHWKWMVCMTRAIFKKN